MINGLNKVRRGIASFSLVMIIAGFFAVSVAQAATFSDVQPSDWFSPYVEQLAADGILNTSTGTYRPADLVNRAEMAKLAVEAFKLTLENPDTPTFKDVPKGSWFYQYVETAAKNGIVGGYKDQTGTLTGYFGPGDSLTREQAMKILVLAAPLATNTKGGPHFSDVPASAWSYEYVETGYNWSVVDGYADGSFGPVKNINRAEIAKMVVNAMNPVVRPGAGFEISSVTATSATGVEVCFSAEVDATQAATATNYSIKDATSKVLEVKSAGVSTDGMCAELVTASQVVDTDYVLEVTGVQSTAKDDLLATTMNFKGYNPNATQQTGGDMSIALSPDSPAAANVPCNAQSLVFAKYDFTATGSKDAIINGVTFKRVDLGSKDDFSKVWMENEAGMRVTARQTIGSDDYVTLNFNPALTVSTSTPVRLSLVAKLKAFNDPNSNGIKDAGENCYTGRINAFSVENAAAVSTSGGVVSGTFPIVSAKMTTADYTTANMTGVVGGSATTYQVGELNQEFAQWKITNNHSTRDILVKTMTIKNEGSGRIAKDLANFGVYVSGTKVSKDAVTSGEYVTFNMNNYVLAAGRTDTFYVRADVVGMDNATGDTIQFTVRYPEDINAVEASTLFGVSHNLDTAFSQAGLDGNVLTLADNAVIYTINGGDTTFVKSMTAPSAQTKPRGATAVTFLESNLIVKQEFSTDAIKVAFYSSVDSAVLPALPVANLTAADLKNLKLYVDSTLIQTKSGDAADFTSCANDPTLGATGIKCVLNFDSTVILKQGTRTIKLIGDIEQNAVSGHKFRAEIAGATAFLSAKYTANDRPISAVAGTVTGGDVSIGNSNLTITENSGYALSQKFVAGVQDFVVAKYTLKANDSDTIKVTRMKFSLIGAGVNGSDIPAASVYVNGVKTGSTKSFTTGVAGSVEFTDVNFDVPSNTQVTVELKASLTNSAAGALQVDLAQLDAKDSSSTDATLNNLANTAAGYQLAANTVDSQLLNIVTNGKLSIANNSNSASGAYLVAGSSTEAELGKFTLSAQDDDIKVTNLYFLTADGTGIPPVDTPVDVSARISSIALYGNDGTKLCDGIINTTYAYFDMGDSSKLVVPKNTNNYTITVKAKFNPITQVAQTLKQVKLTVITAPNAIPGDAVTGTTANGFRAVSTGNNTTLALADVVETGNAQTNLMAVTRTSLSVASVDDVSLTTQNAGSLVVGTLKAYAFSVTADSAGDGALASIVLNITESAGVTHGNVKVYELADPSKIVYNAAYTSGNALIFLDTDTLTTQTPIRIAAGTTKTYVVEVNVTAVPAGSGSLAIKMVPGSKDTSYTQTFPAIPPVAADNVTIWSDYSDSAHSDTVANALDWFRGYKIKGLDSMGQRSYSKNA